MAPSTVAEICLGERCRHKLVFVGALSAIAPWSHGSQHRHW